MFFFILRREFSEVPESARDDIPAGTGLSVGTALIRGSVLRESAFRRLSNRGRERRNRDFSGKTAGPAGLSGEGLVVQIRVTRPFR